MFQLLDFFECLQIMEKIDEERSLLIESRKLKLPNVNKELAKLLTLTKKVKNVNGRTKKKVLFFKFRPSCY